MKNTSIDNEGIVALTKFLEGCPHLVTLGLDIANLEFTSETFSQLLKVVNQKENLRDLAFSIYGSAQNSNYFQALANNLTDCRAKVQFLRLSIANTEANKEDLLNVAE